MTYEIEFGKEVDPCFLIHEEERNESKGTLQVHL